MSEHRSNAAQSVVAGIRAGGAGRLVAIAAEGTAAIVVARALGPPQMGVLATAIAIGSLIALVVVMQVETQAARTSKPDWVAGVAPWTVLAGIVGGGTTLLVAAALSAVGSVEHATTLIAYSPVVALAPALGLINGTLRASGQPVKATVLATTPPLIRLILIGLAIVLLEQARAFHIALIMSVATTVVLGIALPIVHREITFSNRLQWSILRKLLLENLPLLLIATSWLILQRIDVVIVSNVMSDRAAGQYLVALRPAEILMDLYAASHVMFLPAISGMVDPVGLRDVYVRSAYVVSTLLAPALLAYAVWGDIFVATIFGDTFAVGLPVYLFIAAAIYIHSVSGPSGYVLISRRRNRQMVTVAGVVVLVNIVLNLVLIPGFGLAGAASATVAAFIVMNAAYLWLVRKDLALSRLRVRYVKWLVLITASLFAIHITGRAILPVHFLAAASTSLVGLGCTFILARLHPAAREHLRDLLRTNRRHTLQRPIPK